jgi:protein-disulfide isomerase
MKHTIFHRHKISLMALIIAGLLSTVDVQAKTLSEQLYDSLLTQYHPFTCCTLSLGACLKEKSPCLIVYRLNDFGKWLSEKDSTAEKLISAVAQRESTFVTDNAMIIDTAGFPSAGKKGAPICMVLYFSGTCPMCKLALKDMSTEVTSGKLAGKVILVAKPFSTGIADKALMLAHKQHKFWEFITVLQPVKQRLDRSLLITVAYNAGIQADSFTAMLDNPDTLIERTLNRSRDEAVRNGVTITPTIFLDFRRYRSYKDIRWLIDAAEYRYEILEKQHRQKSGKTDKSE